MKYKDYYERTTAARNIAIDSLVKNKKMLHHELLSSVTMTTGLGRRWLDEFLDLMAKCGLISRENDLIIWHNKEARK